MNSQGEESFDIASMAIFLLVMAVVIPLLILGFSFLLGNYKARLGEVPLEVKAELISLRFTTSADCFAYQDQATGRVYPGVIDQAKFTAEQLARCYLPDERTGRQQLNFRLRLEGKGMELLTSKYFHIDDLVLTKKVLVRDEQGVAEDTWAIFVQGER